MAAEEWEVEFKQGTILAAKEWEVECGEQLIQDFLGKKESRKVGWKERKKESKKEDSYWLLLLYPRPCLFRNKP